MNLPLPRCRGFDEQESQSGPPVPVIFKEAMESDPDTWERIGPDLVRAYWSIGEASFSIEGEPRSGGTATDRLVAKWARKRQRRVPGEA